MLQEERRERSEGMASAIHTFCVEKSAYRGQLLSEYIIRNVAPRRGRCSVAVSTRFEAAEETNVVIALPPCPETFQYIRSCLSPSSMAGSSQQYPQYPALTQLFLHNRKVSAISGLASAPHPWLETLCSIRPCLSSFAMAGTKVAWPRQQQQQQLWASQLCVSPEGLPRAGWGEPTAPGSTAPAREGEGHSSS